MYRAQFVEGAQRLAPRGRRTNSFRKPTVRSAERQPADRPSVEDVARFMPEQPQSLVRHEAWIKAAILAVCVIVAAVVAISGKFSLRHSLFSGSVLGNTFWYSAIFYGGLMYAVLIWRVVMWRRYKPMDAVPEKHLPSITVIIPAFNEGALVRQSILSVAANRYPRHKLEIFAIDDGSSDDTWLHIRAAAAEVDPRIRITTHKQPKNMGKRHALYHGFMHGRGDVFISIDSDSVLHPEALRNAVSPVVRNPRIGAVAGCVEVMNPKQSVITRFLKTTFSLSFKFVRAYQNQYYGVFCTPGALSVYRADVVRKVADEWLNQHFLGLPCTTGEDRAMTNLILRDGWLTAYQQNAVVYSQMPHTYPGMVRMLLRWGRSNIRETIILFRFLFKRFRSEYLRTFQFQMVLVALTLVLPPFMIFNSTLLLFTSYGYVMHQMGMLLIYGATMATIYYINERDSDWIWLFLYEFSWVPGFSWIIPYSAFTLRNTGWLTRGNAATSDTAGELEPAAVPATPTLHLPAVAKTASAAAHHAPALNPAVAMAR